MANVATILTLFSLLSLGSFYNYPIDHGYNIFVQIVDALCKNDDGSVDIACRVAIYRDIIKMEGFNIDKRSKKLNFCARTPISRKHVLTSRYCPSSQNGKIIDKDLVIYESEKDNSEFAHLAPIHSEELFVKRMNIGNPCNIYRMKSEEYYIGQCNSPLNRMGVGYYANDSLVGVLIKDIGSWVIVKPLTDKNMEEICKFLGSDYVSDQWESCSNYIK
ncbi:unnamed protein product [Dimorphilus gyrociliatus]|uniref:Uncharacterized protein n=1 Tax=Dimorphilus gyrociliatus TaxID=2664684 RepID=A0A7I8W585_9ANNE|nr:unnamed protein product [Dimorphilus gyrociliatus]